MWIRILIIILFLIAGFLLNSNAIAQEPNLIINPGCETNTSGWTGVNATLTRVTTQAYLGIASCEVSVKGNANSYSLDDSPATVQNPVSGGNYIASAWVKSTIGRSKTAQIVLKQSGGANPLRESKSSFVTLSQTWQQVSVQTTIDPGRTTLEAYVTQPSAVKGDKFDVDEISLILQQPSPTPSPSPTPRTVNVSDSTQLISALNNALPGDLILVADGDYTNTSYFYINTKNGTASQPIVIKAVNRLGAIITGPAFFYIKDSSFVTLEDFFFNNTGNNAVKLYSSNNIRITRNRFDLAENGASFHWINVSGRLDSNMHNNRIDHNTFENKEDPGRYISVQGTDSTVPPESAQMSQNNLIDHNYFYNNGPRISNGKEAITIGSSHSSLASANNIIEFNLFEKLDGEAEVVSIKSADNIVRFNTFKDNQGSLVARHGRRSSFYGNFFSGGLNAIRVYDTDHKIYNNYMANLTGTGAYTPITITNGDIEEATPGGVLSSYIRPRRILIANNTLVDNVKNIEIGLGGSFGTLPPTDLTFSNNVVKGSTNPLVSIITEPINTIWRGNIMYATGSATLGITVSPSEINVIDPLLELVDNLFKLSNLSPAINAGSGTETFVTEDIDGEVRDATPDVGADEYGTLVPVRKPLTPSDVGFNAP